MRTTKLIDKLERFLAFSRSKQAKKQAKLQDIITKLEAKKTGLLQDMAIESEDDETSELYHELEKKMKVVNKLLKKARKHSVEEQQPASDD